MNDGDQAVSFIYLLLLLLLVGSSLLVRRMPIGQSLKMAAAWVLIFAAAFGAFALKDDFRSLGRHILVEVRGGTVQSGETLRIKQAEDGHFWVNAQVNGEDVRFLVDSGATTTSLSAETARRVGVERDGRFQAAVQTANGMVMVDRGTIARLQVGLIAREDMSAHVSESFGDMNVLGMNFLSSLSGWGVEGSWLVLKP